MGSAPPETKWTMHMCTSAFNQVWSHWSTSACESRFWSISPGLSVQPMGCDSTKSSLHNSLCTWAHLMVVASELKADDQPHIALKLISVFNHTFDINLTSIWKTIKSIRPLAVFGSLSYSPASAPSSPSTNDYWKYCHSRIFSLTAIHTTWVPGIRQDKE